MRLNISEWAKWQSWAQRISDDLRSLRDDYAVFREFRAVCKDNTEWISSIEGDFFCSFIFRSYGTAVAVGIRRHLKAGDSASLTQLLKQIAGCSRQITFPFYLERFPRDQGHFWQRETFSALSDGQGTTSESAIQADIERFKAINADVEEYVDRTIAHVDPRGSDKTIYFDDIEASLQEFATLARKYVVFLTGHDQGEFQSTVVFPWKRVFRHPLIKPDDMSVTTASE